MIGQILHCHGTIFVEENHGHIIEPCFIVNHGQYEYKSQPWLIIVTMDHGSLILSKCQNCTMNMQPWSTIVNWYHGGPLFYNHGQTMLNHCQN